jgi:sugar lactone lactonase YvrE
MIRAALKLAALCLGLGFVLAACHPHATAADDGEDAGTAAEDAGPTAGDAGITCSLSPTQLLTDNHNCGACGHICSAPAPASFACEEGHCTVTFAQTSHPDQLALDDDYVYWTTQMSNGFIMKAPKAGGPAVTLASGHATPSQIAVDDDSVYWDDNSEDGVFKVPKGGGATVTLAPRRTGSNGMAIDDTSVYWADGHEAAILKVLKSGGAVTTLTHGLTPSVGSLKVADGFLYWMSTGQGGPVLKMAVSGGAVTTLATNATSSGLWAVGTSTSSLFWADGPNILAVSVSGGATATIFAGVASGPTANLPTGVAVDARSIYWVDWFRGSLATVSLLGGAAHTLAAGMSNDNPQCVVVDDSSVYWTRQGSSAIQKTSK